MARSLSQEKTHVPYFFLKSANIRICSEAGSPRAVAAGRPQATALRCRAGKAGDAEPARLARGTGLH